MSRKSASGEAGHGSRGESPRLVELTGARNKFPRQRTALVVLGMHRSGTSEMARLLGLLGADLPDGSTLPTEGEASEIERLHDELLASAGTTWDDVTHFPPSWFESEKARGFGNRLLDLLERDFGESKLFVVSDPRVARLVPFWESALEEFSSDPRYVLMVRNPLEVAASLKTRHGFLPHKSYLLWLQHVVESERDTRRWPRSIVLYEELLRDWRGVTQRVAGELGLSWPRQSVQASVEIDEFLSDEVRRHRISAEEVRSRGEVGVWCQGAYSALVRAVADGGAGLTGTFDSIRSELATAAAAFGPLVAQTGRLLVRREAEVDRLVAEIDARDQDLQRLGEDLGGLRGEHSALAAKLVGETDRSRQVVEEIRGLKRRLVEGENVLDRLRRKLEAAGEENRRLSQSLADRSRSLEEAKDRRARSDVEVLALTGRLRAAERSIAVLQHDRGEERKRLESVLRSRSWRLTRPLRWLSERFRRREAKLVRMHRRFEESGAAKLFDGVHYRSQFDDPAEVGQVAVLHYLKYGHREGREPHALFDTSFYRGRCPELADGRLDPLTHYFEQGAARGLDPHPLFDSAFYLRELPRPASAQVNPLLHFVREGRASGQRPNPLFDPEFYLAANPDVAASGLNPLEHYVKYGVAERRDPHPDFDSAYYQERNPDWAAICSTPLEHYLTIGRRRGAPTCEAMENKPEAEAPPLTRWVIDFATAGAAELLFDEDWYLWFYPDVRAAVEEGLWRDPFEHYHQRGHREGRSPNATFDETWYRSLYPDVAEMIRRGECRSAYEHFLNSGAAEARHPAPYVDLGWYLEQNADDLPDTGADARAGAYRHFTEVGLRLGREPYPDFDVSYLADNPEVVSALDAGDFAGPYHHYMFHGILQGNGLLIPVEPAKSLAALSRRSFLQEAAFQLDAFFNEGRTLAFDAVAAPLVSVVVIGSDTDGLLLMCLSALRDHAEVPLEVIIVDNASSDRTAELLERVEGATIVRNPTNLHFLRAAMQGAETARGKYLLFLNSDAMIRQGTLPNALAAIESDPRIGVVGGKLIFPSGALQEAGSGMTPEGHPYAFGRDDMPYEPQYMCRRDVVYCSAAFAVTPRRLFEEHGGFDSLFAPAYFEDADYCFRLREAGYRVVYCPTAVCTHVERASSSRSAATEIVFARNRILFRSRHGLALQRMQPVGEDGKQPPPVVDERGRRILVIDDSIPLTRMGSGFPRSRMMVRALVDLGFEVTILPMNPVTAEWSEIYDELPATVECFVGHTHQRLREFLEERRGWYGHLWVSRDHNMRRVRNLCLEKPHLFDGVRIVYDSEAIAADRQAGLDLLEGKTAPRPATRRLLEAELEVGAVARKIVALSERDRARFAARGHDAVLVTETIEVRPGSPRSFAERSDLLFVGAVHAADSPNYDSLAWFTAEVLPLLRQRSDLRLKIAGYWSCPGSDRFRGDGIDFLGAQDDLGPLYDEARIFVAPTRFSAGTPHKVIEAGAYGLPAVVTEQLVEQLGWRPDQEILSASHTDAEAFAGAVLRLYEDEELWTRVRAGVLARIAGQYSEARLMRDLARVFED